jgi:hypothetical protein
LSIPVRRATTVFDMQQTRLLLHDASVMTGPTERLDAALPHGLLDLSHAPNQPKSLKAFTQVEADLASASGAPVQTPGAQWVAIGGGLQGVGYRATGTEG